MLKQLLDHYSKFNLLPDFQSASRQKCSMEKSLLEMVSDILLRMESQEITTVVILDLSTAFDKVSHDVCIDGHFSSSKELNSAYLMGHVVGQICSHATVM